jgi:hypothetical protein
VPYLLDTSVAAKLTKPLAGVDKGVSRIDVGLAPDYLGEETLVFRVVLKDAADLRLPSAELGKRLHKISSVLRRRAADLEVPMFASVRFVAESEIQPRRRKSA